MTPTEIYEVKAEAFYRMTGYMAPGKSVAAAALDTQDTEIRGATWKVWNQSHSTIIEAMIYAFDNVMKLET